MLTAAGGSGVITCGCRVSAESHRSTRNKMVIGERTGMYWQGLGAEGRVSVLKGVEGRKGLQSVNAQGLRERGSECWKVVEGCARAQKAVKCR